MTGLEVLRLLDAGYTKDEIAALEEPKDEPEEIGKLKTQIAELTKTIKGMQDKAAGEAKQDKVEVKTIDDIIKEVIERS